MYRWLLLLWGAIAGAGYAQNIELVATTLWTGMRDVTVAGDYAYAAFPMGLVVFDVSNPSAPQAVAKLLCPGESHAITVSGSFAYIVARSAGLHVIDISYPATPMLTGTANTPGDAIDVTVNNGFAYVADGVTGVRVVDVSDPYDPRIVGNMTTPTPANRISYYSHWLYIISDDYGMLVADVTNPEGPYEIAGYPIYDVSGLSVTQQGYAYLVGTMTNCFQIVDVGDPYAPVFIGTTGNSFADTCYEVSVTGDFAYVSSASGLWIIDMTDPQLPFVTDSVRFGGRAPGVAISAGHAFVAVEFGGLYVYDVADPDDPVLAGVSATPGWINDVCVAGNHAYVADARQGLRVLNVTQPRYFTQVALDTSFGWSNGIVVSGDRAYLTAATPVLPVIDVTDPAHPALLGGTNTPGFEWKVFVQGNFEYVAARERGVHVVDVSDPAQPRQVGSYDTPGSAWDLFAVGNYVYVADAGVGLEVLNVSDPMHPILAGHYWSSGWGWGPSCIRVQDGFAYTIGDITDLLIFDVRTPTNPQLAAVITNEPGTAQGIYVAGERAYVATNIGLVIYDITDPFHPVAVDRFETPGYGWAYLLPRDLHVEGDYVYLADGYALMIFRYQPLDAEDRTGLTPQEFSFSGYPNPFNPTTTLSYTLATESTVKLAVYDVTGARVVDLVHSRQQPGEYRVLWNAAELPSGVYFASLSAGNFTETKKLVLMK